MPGKNITLILMKIILVVFALVVIVNWPLWWFLSYRMKQAKQKPLQKNTKNEQGFFYLLLKNIIDCFSYHNLRWHVFATGLTFILVLSGFDWWYFEATRNKILFYTLFPAAVVGGLMPLAAPLCMYLVGRFRKDAQFLKSALASAQAVVIASLISSFYKAFTGRIQPDLSMNAGADISHEFHFGFLQHGIFWGWPSSHTTIAFAMAFVLITLYPKNRTIKYGMFLYALYIGLGVSISIHWFSDFIAGTIFGTLIGVIVGRSYLKQKNR